MDILLQTARMACYQVMVDNFASLCNCTTVDRSLRLSDSSLLKLSDGQCLTTNVCGCTHHGPVCGLLVFWLQVAIEPFALFHHSVFDYMCFTAMK